MSCDVCDKIFPNLNVLEEHKSKNYKQNQKKITSKTQRAEREEIFDDIFE